MIAPAYKKTLPISKVFFVAVLLPKLKQICLEAALVADLFFGFFIRTLPQLNNFV